MTNLGTPDQGFNFSRLTNAGVCLAQLEFIINRQIGIHPQSLLAHHTLDQPLRDQISGLTAAYPNPRDFFVQRVAEAASMIAAAFAPELECEALRFVRDDMGLTNVKIMIPFIRTLEEAEQVIDLLGKHSLRRGDNGLEVIMMCELPANALLADEFLTQLRRVPHRLQ